MRKNLTINLKILKNVLVIKIGESYFIQFPTVRALVTIRSKAVPVPYRTLRAVLQDVTKIKVIRKKGFKVLCC